MQGLLLVMNTIDLNLIEIALEKAKGSDFEKFAQAFFSETLGENFIPTGGMHDGGADGLILNETFESGEKFLQASIQADHRAKISQTVGRLKDFGRSPTMLTYVTSRVIPYIDKEESDLTDKLKVIIRIRDRTFLINRVNSTPGTIQAFKTHLGSRLTYMNNLGGSSIILPSKGSNLPARTLCVFLGQEIERRSGETELLEAVTDSLILWALEGTDPDQNCFMSPSEIQDKIEGALPSAKAFFRGVFSHRLKQLRSKSHPNGRQIRWHKQDDKYCLPFETREEVAKENQTDEVLIARISVIFERRLNSLIDFDTEADLVTEVIKICHNTIQKTFEKQGLEIALFVSGEEPDSPIQTTISDNIDECIEDFDLSPPQINRIKEICLDVLRKTFYDSTEDERIYLAKLSKTYTLLFTLKNTPQVVEYFRNMSGMFVLYVGADLIIRALSEHYLTEHNRMTEHLFSILSKSGAKLVLTENALEEVYSHIAASDREFTNCYMEIEPYIRHENDFIRQIDRILIRAYFYMLQQTF